MEGFDIAILRRGKEQSFCYLLLERGIEGCEHGTTQGGKKGKGREPGGQSRTRGASRVGKRKKGHINLNNEENEIVRDIPGRNLGGERERAEGLINKNSQAILLLVRDRKKKRGEGKKAHFPSLNL